MSDDTTDPVITRVYVVPDYSKGFVFSWEIRGGFEDDGPWEFLVQMAPSEDGEWSDISPILVNSFAWRSTGPFRVNKDYVLFFRVLMRTKNGVYVSNVVTPYGDLNRREFLIGRRIMQAESLHHRKLGGVEVNLWSISTWGPRCRDCRDPVSGHVRDSHCKKCFGTGYNPAYHGPFMVWANFTQNSQNTTQDHPEGNGVLSQKAFDVNLVASVPLKKNDFIHDVRSGKRYYVDKVDVVTEIRRVPLLQVCHVFEAPVTDAVYRVG